MHKNDTERIKAKDKGEGCCEKYPLCVDLFRHYNVAGSENKNYIE